MSVALPVVLLAVLVQLGCGSDEPRPRADARPAERPSEANPAPRPLVPGGRGHLAVMAPPDGLTLRARPGGRVVARLGRRTRWGSPTIVWALARRGDWLGVVATGLPNDRVAWLNARRERPRMWRSALSLHADLSARTVELRDGGRVRRRFDVTVGAAGSPTPTGRFAVTDKLIPSRRQPFYGCCILALSGTQPHLRPGWAGGNRIAIHGSPTRSVGAAASAGCLRARDRDLRALMKVLPVGTPVVIRP